MSILPIDLPRRNALQQLNNLPNMLNNYVQQANAERDRKHLERLYSANPQFAMGLQNLYNNMQSGGSDLPSDVRSYQFYSKLTPEQQQDFLKTKRGEALKDFGGYIGGIDPVTRQPYMVGQKTLAPSDLPSVRGAQAGAAERAKLLEQLGYEPQIAADVIDKEMRAKREAQLEFDEPDMLLALETAADKYGDIDSKIDEVLEQADVWTTGMVGKIGSYAAGTPQYNLAANVLTLQADSAFDELAEMKAASPTGGALGQVTERELEMLYNARQNLSQSQSAEQFKKNVRAYKRMRKRTFERAARGFERTYGYVPDFIKNATKTQAKPSASGIKFLGFE